MADLQILEADEILETRPFTHVAHMLTDLATMRHMAHQLVDMYDDPVMCHYGPGKRPICQSDPQGRHFRIYYIQPELLFSRKRLTVVGFFGQKRRNADIGPLIQADKQFEDEFQYHSGLLSLSTVRLPNGDFGNLVLFTDPESRDGWNNSPLHRDLVRKISPPYYRSLRLNNAILASGLDKPDEMDLLRVKYMDYSTDPLWWAVRELREG